MTRHITSPLLLLPALLLAALTTVATAQEESTGARPSITDQLRSDYALSDQAVQALAAYVTEHNKKANPGAIARMLGAKPGDAIDSFSSANISAFRDWLASKPDLAAPDLDAALYRVQVVDDLAQKALDNTLYLEVPRKEVLRMADFIRDAAVIEGEDNTQRLLDWLDKTLGTPKRDSFEVFVDEVGGPPTYDPASPDDAPRYILNPDRNKNFEAIFLADYAKKPKSLASLAARVLQGAPPQPHVQLSPRESREAKTLRDDYAITDPQVARTLIRFCEATDRDHFRYYDLLDELKHLGRWLDSIEFVDNPWPVRRSIIAAFERISALDTVTGQVSTLSVWPNHADSRRIAFLLMDYYQADDTQARLYGRENLLDWATSHSKELQSKYPGDYSATYLLEDWLDEAFKTEMSADTFLGRGGALAAMDDAKAAIEQRLRRYAWAQAPKIEQPQPSRPGVSGERN